MAFSGWHTQEKIIIEQKRFVSETEQKTQKVINNILQSDNPLQNITSFKFL